MTDPFTPPVLPRADNSSGLPKPPSGPHPVKPTPTGTGTVGPIKPNGQ